MLLSGRGEAEAERAEQAVRDSGADLTILRATWFAQNFSEDYMLEHVLAGEVALPAGDVPEPFVDADDIADVAVAALTDDGHAGRALRAHRPALLTFADAVAEISPRRRARGPLRAGLARASTPPRRRRTGVPAEVVELLDVPVRRGRSTGATPHTTDGVQRALGREPRDFVDYAREAAATGLFTDQERSVA